MKYPIVLFLLFMCSCGGGDDLNDAEIRAVREAAIRDSRVAAEAVTERETEQAVLAIRARETSLRINGHDRAADLYEAVAEECLTKDSVLIEP